MWLTKFFNDTRFFFMNPTPLYYKTPLTIFIYPICIHDVSPPAKILSPDDFAAPPRASVTMH